MNHSDFNPAKKYIIDAVFYTAFPEYRNDVPEPSWWKPSDFRKIDAAKLREAFNATPAQVADFLINDDRLRNYSTIYRMAREYGYDQFDINQSDYKSLVNKMVFEFMGKPEFGPIMKSYTESIMDDFNGEIGKVFPRGLLGLYAAELFEKSELNEEISRLQNLQA